MPCADKTNLTKFNVGGRASKAHPVYASIGGCGFASERLYRVLKFNGYFSQPPHTFAASLHASIRQAKDGAQVVGLVPVYRWFAHAQVDVATDERHRHNNKLLLWTAYRRILNDLIDDDDPSHFVQGFRCECVAERVSLLSCARTIHMCAELWDSALLAKWTSSTPLAA